MSPSAWERLQDLFHRASALAPAERAAFLDQECGEDTALRTEVERLLAAPDTGAPSMSGVVARAARQIVGDVDLESAGDEIGPYRIVRHLASGGMGEVYLAQQEHPVRRRVALKTIKRGMDTTEILRRFEAERHALARMNHPNIARVLDAGRTADGRPYFVMGHVDGPAITEYCDRHRRTTDERLRLLLEVCVGLQHAHQQGILHRDIKPSNVLVEEIDGRAVPKIIDFGIAKALGDSGARATRLTELGRVIGTPAYMSPEQAGQTEDAVDTRSDVYSLGALAYEVLVGAPPLEIPSGEGGSDLTLRRIREEEPPRPSTRVMAMPERGRTVADARRTTTATLSRTLQGDLDWIVLKALEKEPGRRYQTPADFAADVNRYFAHEPVVAGPPSRLYRMRKFARRHRAAVVGATLVTIALVAGVIGTSIGLVQAQRAEARARSEAAASNTVASFMQNLLLDLDPSRSGGHPPDVKEILSRGARRIRSELADQPAVRARLLGAIGDVYRGIGVYDSARALSVEEMAVVHSLGDTAELSMAEALERRGCLLREVGAPDSARADFRREIAIREAQRVPDKYKIANALRSLAAVEIMQQRFTDAQPLLERELALREQVVPRNEELVVQTAANLGITYIQSGDFVRARGPLERAYAYYLAQPGPPSMNLGISANLLGSMFEEQGIPDSAEIMFRQSLAVMEPMLGPDHMNIAHTCMSIASALLEQDDAAGAEPLALRARGIFAKSQASAAGGVAVADGLLGEIYRRQGRLREAQRTLAQSVAGQEQAFGPTDARLGGTLVSYAACLRDLGQRDEGRRVARRAVEILATALPEGHPQRKHAQQMLDSLEAKL